MVNTMFVGTHLNNGTADNSTACVTGFDEVGFMVGTSASLFNVRDDAVIHSVADLTDLLKQILDFANNRLSMFNSADAAGLIYVLRRQLEGIRTRANDVANWPNARFLCCIVVTHY